MIIWINTPAVTHIYVYIYASRHTYMYVWMYLLYTNSYPSKERPNKTVIRIINETAPLV